MSSKDNHRPCACGAELTDECGKCAGSNPLGSMRIVAPAGSGHDERCESEFIPEAGAWTPCRCGEVR